MEYSMSFLSGHAHGGLSLFERQNRLSPAAAERQHIRRMQRRNEAREYFAQAARAEFDGDFRAAEWLLAAAVVAEEGAK